MYNFTLTVAFSFRMSQIVTHNALIKLILSPGLLMIWLTGLSLLVVLLWRL